MWTRVPVNSPDCFTEGAIPPKSSQLGWKIKTANVANLTNGGKLVIRRSQQTGDLSVDDGDLGFYETDCSMYCRMSKAMES